MRSGECALASIHISARRVVEVTSGMARLLFRRF